MINIEITDINVLIAFWLCFSRCLATLIQIPIFDNTAIPIQVKILCTFLFCYGFFPYVEKGLLNEINYFGEYAFWILTIFHTFIGLVLGFIVKSIISVFISAGSLITQQVGFGAIRYFDPASAQTIGPFEKLIMWTVLILVISSGALLPIFKGLFLSFQSLDYFNFSKLLNMGDALTEFMKGIVLSAIMLATPLIFTNLLIMTILGIIAKTVPQMNIIMVSFVVNIGLGLLVFSSNSDEFFNVAFKVYTEKLALWFKFVS